MVVVRARLLALALIRLGLLALFFFGAALLRFLLFLLPLLVPGRVFEIDAAEVRHDSRLVVALLGRLWRRGGV